jgi:hypothetical protein
MAVEFRDDSYTITIYTGCDPIEDWLNLHNELLLVLSAWDSAQMIIDTPRHVLGLLERMMPERETAIKMKPIQR